LPISLYRKPSLLRDWLTYYKPNIEQFEPNYGTNLCAILHAVWVFARDNLEARTGGWHKVVVVPSSGDRVGIHPLEDEIAKLDEYAYCRPLRRGLGGLGHRRMNDAGFVVTKDVSGQRLLVIDDVYTTGARSQSASSALTLAGAEVVGIMVIGRRINPDFSGQAARVWDRQVAKKFSFDSLFLDA
jgi:hypothetical protein